MDMVLRSSSCGDFDKSHGHVHIRRKQILVALLGNERQQVAKFDKREALHSMRVGNWKLTTYWKHWIRSSDT